MAVEPIWLSLDDVVAIHDEAIRRHGGLAGIKDIGLVESAIASPVNLFLYQGEDDSLVLAIRLCFTLAKNHGFLDGNKRVAAASMIEFLALNGFDLFIPDDEPDSPLLGQWIEKLVRDDYSETQLHDRLEHFVQAR